MNDLYFTAKNKKCLRGRKPSRQASIFGVSPIKRAKYPYFGNKKAITPIFSYQNYGFFMVRETGLVLEFFEAMSAKIIIVPQKSIGLGVLKPRL